MKVVEQPFCRGSDELSGPDIVGQGSIRVPQHAGVLVEPAEDVTATAPRARVESEARREDQGTLFQPLDAQQLVAKRFLGRSRPAVQQLTEEAAHRTDAVAIGDSLRHAPSGVLLW